MSDEVKRYWTDFLCESIENLKHAYHGNHPAQVVFASDCDALAARLREREEELERLRKAVQGVSESLRTDADADVALGAWGNASMTRARADVLDAALAANGGE